MYIHKLTSLVWPDRFCPYIHTYIYTYIYTYIHTYIHTYMYTYVSFIQIINNLSLVCDIDDPHRHSLTAKTSKNSSRVQSVLLCAYICVNVHVCTLCVELWYVFVQPCAYMCINQLVTGMASTKAMLLTT